MAKVWKDQASSSPAAETYEKRLAAILQKEGCDEYYEAGLPAPYVLRGLLRNFQNSDASFFSEQSPQLPNLAKAFLDEERCPGARGLSDAEKAKLEAIRDRPLPPTSKP